MTPRQQIKNEAPAHYYFTTMLNMADDDLDPFQYRLLAHYVRVCGQEGKDVIDESVRETAKSTKMSTVKVQKARDELEKLGYLKLSKPTAAQARKGETVHISIVDRWSENINRYAKAVSKITQPTDEPVLNIVQDAVPEIAHYVSEPVLNLARSLKNKEQNTFAPNSADKFKPRTKPIPASEMNPMKDVIVAAFQYRWETMTPSEKGLVQKAARELCLANVTPADVPSLYAYCAKNFTKFKPMALPGNLSEWRKTQSAPKSALDGLRIVS